MRMYFSNILSVVFSFIKFSIIWVFRVKQFKFHLVERFSPNTQVSFIGKGKISLGKAVRAHSQVKIRAINSGFIKIGDNTSINYGCILMSMGKINIGKGVEFGPYVLIYDHDHDFRVEGGIKTKNYRKGDIVIGDNCWIGANTVILKDTYLGRNCVVGAGSVLKGNYPDNSIIVQKRKTITNNYKESL